MSRSTSTNYSTPSFPKANADTDPFDASDVQQLAAAVDGHDHSSGKGLSATVADGSITSAKIQDGAIATVDLANGAVTNAKLAADTARLNLLTNGGFEIWQRGNGPFTGGFCADRWNLSGSLSTISVSPAGGANVDIRSNYCAQLTYTHTASGFIQCFNMVAVDNQLFSGPVAFSIRVKTTVANVVRADIYLGGSNHNYSAYHSGSGQYETLTVTIASVPVALMQIGIYLTNASATVYVDNAMLVVGSVPSDYVPLHPADDLNRCLRYYEPVGTSGSGALIVWGIATAASQRARASVRFQAPKPVAPTITKLGTWILQNTGAQPTIQASSADGFYLDITATTTGDFYALNQGAGSYVTAEANP